MEGTIACKASKRIRLPLYISLLVGWSEEVGVFVDAEDKKEIRQLSMRNQATFQKALG